MWWSPRGKIGCRAWKGLFALTIVRLLEQWQLAGQDLQAGIGPHHQAHSRELQWICSFPLSTEFYLCHGTWKLPLCFPAPHCVGKPELCPKHPDRGGPEDQLESGNSPFLTTSFGEESSPLPQEPLCMETEMGW